MLFFKMKIAILTPRYLPQINGNTTTVERLVIGLKNKKILTKVIDLSTIKNNKKILKIIKKFYPDIILGIHAFKSGVIALEISRKLKKPLVMIVSGTDANHDLLNKERRKKIVNVLTNSQKIIVFHKSIKFKVIQNLPSSKNRIRIIKQSVRLERKKFDLRKKLKLSKNDFVFLLPAGIRKIKYQNFCIDGFKRIHSKYNNVKVVIAGPVLEKDFAHSFFNKIKNLKWIYYLDKIPHDSMFYAMKSADVVMNTSISEGGMSNGVLEAMYVGKPVLASNIGGNSSIIKNNFNGLLFNSKRDFFKKAEQLIKDKKLRDRLGKKSKEILRKNFSFKEEIRKYVKVYEGILD